jgi:hypothetical protein
MSPPKTVPDNNRFNDDIFATAIEGALKDWARFSGFVAFALFALVGSLLWALNYPPQDAEWSCKAQGEASQPSQPNQESIRIFSCQRPQPEKLQSAPNSADARSNKDSGDDIKITDKLLVIFTGLLVMVGACQAYYLLKTVEATGGAAEAAQDAAIGLKSAERPHMVVSELKVSGRNSAPNAEGNVEILLAIQVMNFGRSPAFVRDLSLQIIFGKELPSVPAYTTAQQLRGATVPTRSWGTEWPEKIGVPAFLVQLSNVQKAEMFVFGYFKYADIFELPHETAFAYQIIFDPGADSSKHFTAADPSAYWRYT